jgi:hypothetical protein
MGLDPAIHVDRWSSATSRRFPNFDTALILMGVTIKLSALDPDSTSVADLADPG